MAASIRYLACFKCRSKRDLLEVNEEVYCMKHYTEFLETKIYRLNELVASDKKEMDKLRKTKK